VQFGIIINAGDPRTIAELAVAAEAAGWDGAFTYDAIAIGDTEMWDPWVVMAAMATRTERIRLGAILTPPSRRRPWKLAREALTIDHLSGGRLVLPVGLGALDDAGFGAVGEPTDARTRAELLDESLEILAGLWTGEAFSHDGRHFRIASMTMRPRPVQQPRIPIWIAAAWPRRRSMARAVRWDGILPQIHDANGANVPYTPERIREIVEWIGRERAQAGLDGPFDVVVDGQTPADDAAAAAATIGPWIDAGATWWTEVDWQTATVESIRQRIEAGPPRPPA